MPKDEFDFDDPLELNGVALFTEEDTTDAMAECFIEEFMRLGYNHKQILVLFRNPHYLGMNMVLQNRGEPFVRNTIAEVFARWGRKIEWPAAGSSRREENLRPKGDHYDHEPTPYPSQEGNRTTAAQCCSPPGRGKGGVRGGFVGRLKLLRLLLRQLNVRASSRRLLRVNSITNSPTRSATLFQD